MQQSQRPQAERRLQLSFSKSGVFIGLIVALLVVFAHGWMATRPDRMPQADSQAAVQFDRVALDSAGFAPLRVAGAWRVRSSEPRMGGVSAMALDGRDLIAVTDSGVTIRLPRPVAATGIAQFRDLPAGPGRGFYKAGRDSEALARDAQGRGWWVMFENLNSAWLFDRDFKQAIEAIDLSELDWRSNFGAEGAVSAGGKLLLFPESGVEVVDLGAASTKRIALANRFGRLSDATMLPDGRIVVIARTYSPGGFSSRLLLYDQGVLAPLARLALGRLDNAEAIAAEPLAGGGTRIWVMTDNDFRRRVPTLLVALDWRGNAPRR